MHQHVVMVVDDDRSVLDLFADSLGQSGCRVLTATDGAAAVRELESEASACLVLSDVRMPRQDGWDLERSVHRVRPGLPVVLITSDRLLSIRAPVRDKPFAPGEIQALVRSYCRAGRDGST